MRGQATWLTYLHIDSVDELNRRNWIFGLTALFFHGIADPALTYAAVAIYEVGIETNPWMAESMSSDIGNIILIHLPLYLFVIAVLIGFSWLFSKLDESEVTMMNQLITTSWIVIILWGLLLVMNNAFVLLSGLFGEV